MRRERECVINIDVLLLGVSLEAMDELFGVTSSPDEKTENRALEQTLENAPGSTAIPDRGLGAANFTQRVV
jgi:hypothetical protein